MTRNEGRVVISEMILVWILFSGLTGCAVGLIGAWVQRQVNVQPADVVVNFNYQVEDVSGDKK